MLSINPNFIHFQSWKRNLPLYKGTRSFYDPMSCRTFKPLFLVAKIFNLTTIITIYQSLVTPDIQNTHSAQYKFATIYCVSVRDVLFVKLVLLPLC